MNQNHIEKTKENMINQSKNDSYKHWIEGIFDRASTEYGTAGCDYFNYFGERLVQMTTIPEHARVLDVATGKGAILFPLSKIIKYPGNITGIDISQQMVNETALEVTRQDIEGVVLQQMDAESLQFPDNSFDVVFCGFALFFFPSLQKALAEFKRVLKPGGILAVSIWGENKTMSSWAAGQAKIMGVQQSIVVPLMKTSQELYASLHQAAFADIHIKDETKTFTHATFEAWWQSLLSHGIRGYFEALSSEQMENLREEAHQKVVGSDGIDETLQVFYGVAKKR